MGAAMKTTRFLIAILFLGLAQIHAKACEYPAWYNSNGYGWVGNATACVSSVTISGWDGCTGKVNVTIEPIIYDPIYCFAVCQWLPSPPEIPIEIWGNGVDINGSNFVANSSTTLYSFDITARNSTTPQLVTIMAYLGVSNQPDDAPSASSMASPNCHPRKCAPTGPCSCRENGANSPDNSATCSLPINLATGNTYITETDVKRLPGTGPGLRLERTWNSLWPTDEPDTTVGLFGPHWRSNYEERVYVASDGMMEYSAADGSFTYFALNGSSWTAAVPLTPTTVLTQGSNYWTLTFAGGETRYFSNTSGNLIAINDRNGNSTQIAYDSLGRISTVTDSASRHLYFAYASATSLMVSTVTSDVGIALSYAYDSQGRLVTVTNPDKSTENFEYNDPNNSYLITAVKDSQGKILESHTYDNTGRGLTGSRANGVEAVSISYSN